MRRLFSVPRCFTRAWRRWRSYFSASRRRAWASGVAVEKTWVVAPWATLISST